LRSHLGEVFRELEHQQESPLEEGYLQPDQVHMVLAISPKSAVAQGVGNRKGKRAIPLARV
jgi:putative transposase